VRLLFGKHFGQYKIFFGQPFTNLNLSAMKRVFLVAMLVFAVSLASFARKFVAEGKTFTILGDYKIEIADNPINLMGKELKSFIISYENTNMEVTVAFEKTRKGMNYYVLSPALSVKYVCNGKYFGVSKLNKELLKEGYKTSDSALNRDEYFHQKVLTGGKTCDLDNAKLIAAYYPMLLNGLENELAAK
jgi:hypothetical protein